MNNALLSSKKMDWCTPQGFFDALNAEFSFALDAAATDKTAKCPLYFTPETDGLKSSWKVAGGGYGILQSSLWPRNWQMGSKGIRRGEGRNNGCASYPRPDRHKLFSRIHIRESRNPLYSRAVAL